MAAEIISARMAAARIYELLGIRLVSAEKGVVVLEVACDERHANVDGVVHGGFVSLVADTAMGFAVRTTADLSWTNRTLNLSIDWFEAAHVGDTLIARAEVDHETQRFRWATAEMTTGSGAVIARARSLNSLRPPA